MGGFVRSSIRLMTSKLSLENSTPRAVTRFTAATSRLLSGTTPRASRQDVPATQKKWREWALLQASEPAVRPFWEMMYVPNTP